ncbi:unnamed protein product, partial [marine sediment metagenome]
VKAGKIPVIWINSQPGCFVKFNLGFKPVKEQGNGFAVKDVRRISHQSRPGVGRFLNDHNGL